MQAHAQKFLEIVHVEPLHAPNLGLEILSFCAHKVPGI